MANSKTGTRTETTYEFVLDQEDIVGIMNDDDVMIQDGEVSIDQKFTLFLKKSNGTELLLREMKPSDKLVFRYTVVEVVNEDPVELDGIDVQA